MTKLTDEIVATNKANAKKGRRPNAAERLKQAKIKADRKKRNRKKVQQP